MFGERAGHQSHRKEKEKKRKDYAFRRQFNEKPSIILGCPGTSHIHIQLTHEVALQETQFSEVLVLRTAQHKPTCLWRLPLMDAATRLRSASATASALRKASASTASSRMNLHCLRHSFNHPTHVHCKGWQHKPVYT